MLNLKFSYQVAVDSAYIITIPGHSASEDYSRRCQASCQQVGMSYKVWDAFDGTQPGEIKVPEQLQNDKFFSMLKIMDHYLTKGEVACALSHISLWAHCAAIDKPIVILEHDAVMVKKFEAHLSYNSIVFLGSVEWAEQGWQIAAIPPHASEGPNYHFICRAHAYSIDPPMAKNLLSYVLKNGINTSLDMMIRADLFHITHQGLFAYDKVINRGQDTTILNRPRGDQAKKRNDDLDW